MFALRSRYGYYSFVLFLLLSSSSFFPRLISAVADRTSTILHTWCGLSAKLECRYEMCCTRLDEIQDAKIRQKSPSHNFVGLPLQRRHISTIGKNFLNSNTSSTFPHNMVNFGPLTAEIGLGHPCKFQRVSRLGSVTTRHSSSGRQPKFAALNRVCRLYSAGRPSRWALAHI